MIKSFAKEKSKLKREVRLYSDINDSLITTISSTSDDISQDEVALKLIAKTFSAPIWFRTGDGEYRMCLVKKVKLGKMIDEDKTS